MIGNALENILQVALRIDVIQLTCSCRAPDYAE